MNIQKMQKIQKILAIVIMAMILITTASTAVMALTEPKLITADDSVKSEAINTAGKQIVGILQTVGVSVSVIVLIIIGIKYMMGSAEEKAEYKKTFMPYIIGAALIFAASVFAQVAFDFFTGLGGSVTNAK